MGLPELRSIQCKNLVLAYRESGKGTAILLLHGIGSNSRAWAGQLDGLSGHYRVIAWDAPGYGGSSGLEAGDSPGLEEYADALNDFLDALEIQSAHVAGHSFGGAIAAVFADRYPDRALRLILTDSTRGGGVRPEPERKARLESRLEDLEKLGPAGLAEARAPKLVSKNAPPELAREIRAIMAEIRPEGYRQAAVALSLADTSRALQGVSSPAFVLCGVEDGITPVEESRAICGLLPNGRLELIPDAGHASHQEQPGRYNEAVLRFLASVDRAAPETP